MLAATVALGVSAPVRPAAAADVKRECATAAESAQRLRKDHKLREAREQLVVCARAACPNVVRSDCEPWLAEVDAAVPSVLVQAKDRAGRELLEVRVTVDGVLMAERLDGKPIALNPGSHGFRFEHGSDPPVEASVTLAEGDKAHPLPVTLGPEEAKAPSAEEETPVRPPPPAGGSVVPGLVVGAIGVAAVGTFAYFYLSARSDISELERTCAPRCSQASVDAADTKALVSYVSLGAGVVALGIATYMIVSASSSRPTRPALVNAGVKLDLFPTTGGGMAGLQGRF